MGGAPAFAAHRTAERDRLRIGLLTPVDTRRRGHGSLATAFYMAEALRRQGADVVHISTGRSPVPRFARLGNRVARRLAGRPCHFHNTWLQAWDWARRFGPKLHGVDVLLAAYETAIFASLNTGIPIVYASDATFALVRDYYPSYTGLPRWNARVAEQIERAALGRAALLAYPSEWAAASARDHYGVPAQRVHVIPWGANLDDVPTAAAATAPRRRDRCRLLFAACDWSRKGGDVAYDTVRRLCDLGIDAELVVVGCAPVGVPGSTRVRVFRYLDKEDPVDRDRLSQLFLDAHFLVLPTRADCTPRVLCEASAHGTPSIAPDTGGVGAAITEGENGFLVASGAGAGAYAEVIARVWADHARYQALVCSSRAAFEQTLNWDAWARQLMQRMAALPFCTTAALPAPRPLAAFGGSRDS